MLNIDIFACLKALVDHAHHGFKLSQRFVGGRANNTDRILTGIGQITPMTPLNVTFRINLTPDSGRF